MDEIISHDLKLYLNLYKEYLFSISYEIENSPYVMFRGIFSHKTSYPYFGPISWLYTALILTGQDVFIGRYF